MPAMPEPRPKVSASIFGVRMPIEEAMRRFWVTARICKPQRVRLRMRRRAMNTAIEKAKIHSRLAVMFNSPTLKLPDIQPGLATSRFVGPKITRTPCCRINETPQVASNVSSGRS